MSDFDAINDKVMLKLTSYMKSTELSASDVSIKTGLSLNTVKSYLPGKPMSSDSFIKLCKLGSEFTALLGKESDEQQTFQTGFKTVYCDGHGNTRKNVGLLSLFGIRIHKLMIATVLSGSHVKKTATASISH